ncbi:MAG: hypothetical protein JXA83_15625 [Acidimicrobiales bacterium]|nr:hypothetical protein [Acidimicrobiales bacterium]
MANCDEGECAQALARAVEARNRILSICSELDQIRKDQSAHRALAMLLVAAAVMMLAAALALLTLPWPFNLLAAIPAAVAAGLLIAFGVQMGIVASLQQAAIDAVQRLGAARAELDAAVATVMDECDAECWALVDLDQPACDAEAEAEGKRTSDTTRVASAGR